MSPLNIVVLESSFAAATDLQRECAQAETQQNHVLCRGQQEPLHEFGSRVVARVKALRRKSRVQRVSYLMGPVSEDERHVQKPQQPVGAPHPAGLRGCSVRARAQLLRELAKLLQQGANLTIVVTPERQLNLIELVDPLLALAPPGATVKANVSPDDSELPVEIDVTESSPFAGSPSDDFDIPQPYPSSCRPSRHSGQVSASSALNFSGVIGLTTNSLKPAWLARLRETASE
jgi:hypothetical protein